MSFYFSARIDLGEGATCDEYVKADAFCRQGLVCLSCGDAKICSKGITSCTSTLTSLYLAFLSCVKVASHRTPPDAKRKYNLQYPRLLSCWEGRRLRPMPVLCWASVVDDGPNIKSVLGQRFVFPLARGHLGTFSSTSWCVFHAATGVAVP